MDSSDASIPACAADLLPVMVDSVDIYSGSVPPSYNYEGVTWGEGADIELVYGSQGPLMLVADILVRGSGLLPQNLTPYGNLPFDLELSMEGWGVVVAQGFSWDGMFHNDEGTRWYETVMLPFEIAVPAEGEAIGMRLKLGCFEIQRTLIAHLPEE